VRLPAIEPSDGSGCFRESPDPLLEFVRKPLRRDGLRELAKIEMPNYTFQLRDGSDPIDDNIGVTLANRRDAYQYARGVVRELMTGRETQTRNWRLDVYEENTQRVFAITFASLDDTLEHLQPEMRVLVAGAVRPGLLLS
jgi:hypothetical protein